MNVDWACIAMMLWQCMQCDMICDVERLELVVRVGVAGGYDDMVLQYYAMCGLIVEWYLDKGCRGWVVLGHFWLQKWAFPGPRGRKLAFSWLCSGMLCRVLAWLLGWSGLVWLVCVWRTFLYVAVHSY
jgi:hypothetical protein